MLCHDKSSKDEKTALGLLRGLAALCAAIRDWTIAQIPGGAADLDQLVCDGKTLRGSIEPTAGGGSAFIAQVTLYSPALGGKNLWGVGPCSKTLKVAWVLDDFKTQ